MSWPNGARDSDTSAKRKVANQSFEPTPGNRGCVSCSSLAGAAQLVVRATLRVARTVPRLDAAGSSRLRVPNQRLHRTAALELRSPAAAGEPRHRYAKENMEGSMNIVTLLNQIDSSDIVLPAIQRDFVWSEDKIEKLMDSIMRGYPVGIVLVWETYKDIQFRQFEKVYLNGTRPSFIDKSTNKKLKLVLDGQQRLQALYLSLYGSYKGKYLYFDVLSGRVLDDFEEDKS